MNFKIKETNKYNKKGEVLHVVYDDSSVINHGCDYLTALHVVKSKATRGDTYQELEQNGRVGEVFEIAHIETSIGLLS